MTEQEDVKTFGLLLSEYKKGTVKNKSGDVKCDNAGVFCVMILTV